MNEQEASFLVIDTETQDVVGMFSTREGAEGFIKLFENPTLDILESYPPKDEDEGPFLVVNPEDREVIETVNTREEADAFIKMVENFNLIVVKANSEE